MLILCALTKGDQPKNPLQIPSSRMHTHTYTHTHARTHTHTNTHTHTPTSNPFITHAHTHTYTPTHARTHAHTHKHTHTHTHLYVLLTAKTGHVSLPGRGRETQKGILERLLNWLLHRPTAEAPKGPSKVTNSIFKTKSARLEVGGFEGVSF